ncbi:MAG TPA: DUF3822 family protein [Flavitalea sp.]|nr:DUF3822 family protein [Flavitalea sp.]
MVHPAFNIGTEAAPPEDARLLVEISTQSLNFILFREEPRELLLLRQYRIYTTSHKTVEDAIAEIISGDEYLQSFASRATVLYNFPESNLLPQELNDVSVHDSLTRFVYGDVSTGLILDEKIENWQMHNVYAISRKIHFLLKEKFKDSGYWHFYTLMLRSSAGETLAEGNYLRIIFYNDKFIVSIFTNGRLLLLQTFAYQTPEDVAYYLLLACRQLEIPASATILLISGLIDTQSALYSELMKYFPEIRYELFPESMDPQTLLKEFPGHYFSPLLNMSLCV